MGTGACGMKPTSHALVMHKGPRSTHGVHQVFRIAFRYLWLIALLGAAWESGSRMIQSVFVPPISLILIQFIQDWMPFEPGGVQNLLDNAVPTLLHMLSGWAVAGVIGIACGLLLGRVRVLELLAKPLVAFGMNVPPPALLPLAIMLFGFSSEGMLFLIAFGSVWPVLFNTLDAARSVEPSFIAASRVLHFRTGQFFARVLLPACSPRVVAGLRISLSLALILTVIAEMYGATSGIGKTIVSAQRSFEVLEMWSGILMLALLGLLVNRLFLMIERRLLGWQLGWKRVNR
jgi:ABC-type nitrate/sulfonate/bicarbonate transport system permease component